MTAAYLAAGGSPVETDDVSGFFAGKPPGRFNPDAAPGGAVVGVIAAVRSEASPRAASRPFEDPPTRISIAVGVDGVVFRDGGCVACFARTSAGLEPGEPPVAIQALAALAWQRIILGLAPSLGAVRLDGEPLGIARCEAHR